VVVNDNLVLIDHINDSRRNGEPLSQAIRNAGVRRFRAVFLISSTTMVGLLPMIAERSLQAQFMIPMAVALGFGTMFSSTISLILVPSLYYVSDELGQALRRLFSFGAASEPAWVEPVSIAASVDKTFTNNAEDESEKLQWHVGLDEAYEIGYQAALAGSAKKSPFDLEVLVASWEAGWDDGREELRLRQSGATD
jgi:ribosome modulation factor